jgi:ABC-2 type transport system ATP-binding protein
MKALSIKNLKKTYSTDKTVFEALKGVDLEVEKGDFFALLGPNGAGKSTTINIFCSLVNKNSGEVLINGVDIDKDFDMAKTHLGVVPQEFNFGWFEKVEDIIINQAGYYGIARDVAVKRTEKYLKKLDLWDKRKNQAMMLSGGMKRRLMIARALVHEPAILILDEPTAGVDVELRTTMWEFIREINKKGTTIILTTHYLEEAEELCKNIAIIDKGQIVVNTSMKELLKTADSQTIVMDVKEDLKVAPKLKHGECVLVEKNTLEVKVPKNDPINDVFLELSNKGITVLSMKNKKNRLEELFLELTKKKVGGRK